MIALIDCDNFFVSCERIFRPDLNEKPVVVLSSNDGCAIARSNQAKDIGIPMGAPIFKYRELFEKQKVISFSANFELYGDISKRLTNLLLSVSPRMEIYSIDESFLDISTLEIPDYEAWGRALRKRVAQEIGIPVSVGIAPNKTLAKLASTLSKRQPKGTLLLEPGTDVYESSLKATDVSKLWGIGRKLAPKLKSEGIFTAWQLSNLPPRHLQQLMGIRGRQMLAELNGVRCFGLSQLEKPQKSIMKGRTFGEDTNAPHAIESAIAILASQAAFRLRTENQLTRRAAIMLETSRFKPGYSRWYREVSFSAPTADSGEIITALHEEFIKIYQKNQMYHRANIFLHDFTTNRHLQPDLFGDINIKSHERAKSRMQAIDNINNKFGRNHIRFASSDLNLNWQPKRRKASPAYTTKWPDIPTARILNSS